MFVILVVVSLCMTLPLKMSILITFHFVQMPYIGKSIFSPFVNLSPSQTYIKGFQHLCETSYFCLLRHVSFIVGNIWLLSELGYIRPFHLYV